MVDQCVIIFHVLFLITSYDFYLLYSLEKNNLVSIFALCSYTETKQNKKKVVF